MTRQSLGGRRSHGMVPGLALAGVLALIAIAVYGLAAGGDGGRAGGDGLGLPRDRLRAVLEGAGGEDVAASSIESFCSDLAQASRDEADRGYAAVGWEAGDDLPSAASDLLKRYGDQPRAELVTVGYLDLKGRVWGAMVRSSEGWVDIVSVCAANEDSGEADRGTGTGDGGGGSSDAGVDAQAETAVIRIVRLR